MTIQQRAEEILTVTWLLIVAMAALGCCLVAMVLPLFMAGGMLGALAAGAVTVFRWLTG